MISSPINVVGNAKSLFDQNYGELIDAYPTVRINYVDKLIPEKQGTRWDYLATSQAHLIEKYKEKNWHTLIWTKWKTNLPCPNKNAMITPDDLVISIQKKMTKRPSTGGTLLHYLEHLDVEHVNIFGFDWKQTNSYYQDDATERRVNTPHDYADERKICMELIEKRGWKLYQ